MADIVKKMSLEVLKRQKENVEANLQLYQEIENRFLAEYYRIIKEIKDYEN